MPAMTSAIRSAPVGVLWRLVPGTLVRPADGGQPAGNGGRRASGLGLAGAELHHHPRIGRKRRHAARAHQV